MYLNFFNLKHRPFDAKAGEASFFMCKQHLLACQRLENALKRPTSLTVLTGVAGSGKSTLVETCLATVSPDMFVAHLTEPDADPRLFLQSLLEQVGFQRLDAKLSELRNMLSVVLRQQKLHKLTGVLVIENAEAISDPVLQEIQHLTEIELRHQKVLKAILVGNEELVPRLVKCHLPLATDIKQHEIRILPFSETETAHYIEYRLILAGAESPHDIFSPDTYSVVYRYTGGVPGVINLLAGEALEHAFERGASRVSINDILTAISKLELKPVDRGGEAKVLHSAVPENRTGDEHPRLLVTEKGKLIAEYTLDKNRIVIGRDSRCDVRINARFVSHYQSLIMLDPRGAMLFDLHSTNGTFVNARRVTQQRLKDSDIITVGKYRLKFLSGKHAAERPEEEVSLTSTQLIPALGEAARSEAGDDQVTQKIKSVN